MLKDIFPIIEHYIGGSQEPPMLSYYREVSEQARPHTTRLLRSDKSDITDRRRPHESKAIQEYRAENRRQFTREVFEDFLSALNRVLKNGNIEIQGASKVLKEWLSEAHFKNAGKNYDLLTFAHECILSEALADPNQLLVAFPYNAENPNIPPSLPLEQGGQDPSKSIAIDNKVIPWEDFAYLNEDVLVYKGGDRLISDGKTEKAVPFYFAADKMYWYTLEPQYVSRSSQPGSAKIGTIKEVKYTAFIWYKHDSGESPVNFLPGQMEKTKTGFFLESFLRPAFEVGDEFMGRFSDEQAVSVKYAHPIPAVYPTECKAARCNGGYIDGNRNNACSVCKGDGEVLMPGPYEVYRMPESNAIDGDKNIKDPIRFIHPGVDIGQQAFSNWRTLLLMMKNSVGLDLLEGTANESGRAKEMRLEKLQDRLSRIASALFGGTLTNHLVQVEALLTQNPARRKKPSIHYPRTFHLDGADDLKEAANTALAEDRFSRKMAYYQDQYRNNPEQLRLKELAMCYAPLLLLNEEERTDGLNKGVYSEEDFIKAYNVEVALYKLSKQGQVTDKDEAVFAAIDQYLIDRGMIVQKAPQEIQEAAGRSTLLDTVGGVQGIAEISKAVAEGAMTENAAERLLMEVYGFAPDVAQSLIESPVPAS